MTFATREKPGCRAAAPSAAVAIAAEKRLDLRVGCVEVLRDVGDLHGVDRLAHGAGRRDGAKPRSRRAILCDHDLFASRRTLHQRRKVSLGVVKAYDRHYRPFLVNPTNMGPARDLVKQTNRRGPGPVGGGSERLAHQFLAFGPERFGAVGVEGVTADAFT